MRVPCIRAFLITICIALTACTGKSPTLVSSPESSNSAVSNPVRDSGWAPMKYDADSKWGASCVASIEQGEYRRGEYVQDPGVYPFVQAVGEALWVGARGGGLAPLPVGRITLMVDQQSPVAVPAGSGAALWPASATNSAQVRTEVAEVLAVPADSRPITAINGDVARALLGEMLQGNTITLVHFSDENIASAPAVFRLDESFKVALASCGIPF